MPASKPPKPPRVRSFVCPRCRVPSEVKYTRNVGTLVVRRGRECPKCDYHVITEERPRTTG